MFRGAAVLTTVLGAMCLVAALVLGYTTGVVADRPEAEPAFRDAELTTLVVAALTIAVAGGLLVLVGAGSVLASALVRRRPD
ncbi:hypothetical protein [Isoptericola haloaureus]|uniref:Secreted protein with PEP-CTERM sorting signal n=1 Tax=Isoptericola haloaureus TaxID=1542902 RepID=A0ABU7Z8Y9_9MICO